MRYEARIIELERDLAKWENARDVWMATDKAKDEKIAELESKLEERDEEIYCLRYAICEW